MATSTDVTLPKQMQPIFPDCCVVCEQTPNTTAKILSSAQNPLSTFLLPILFFFGWSRVEFPICHSCKTRFYFQRWGRTFFCWTILAIAIVVVMPFFDEWERVTRRIAVVVVALVVCVPYFLFEVLVPRSFDVTSSEKTTIYEFASRQLGEEFYRQNREAYPSDDISIEIG